MRHLFRFSLPFITLIALFLACTQKDKGAANETATVEAEETAFVKVETDNEAHHPHLSIPDSVFIGVLTDDEPIKTVEIEMTNTGDVDLYVTDATAECDCTTAEILNRKMMPREKGIVKATLDLSDYLPGHIIRRFFLTTNDLRHHYVYVTLAADKQ